MKICLVIDDSPIIRTAARQILEELAFFANEAGSGASALGACRTAMPDAILLDGAMPEMSGIDFLRFLRKEPGGAKPRVIYCPSENDKSQIGEALSAGADAFLPKPYDREDVSACLRRAGVI